MGPVDKDQIVEFARKVQALINRSQRGAHLPDKDVTVTFRRRYAALWTEGGKVIWCFVEMATGDILKPDSWRRPAKHARGSLHAIDMDIDKMTAYGPPYLR